MLCDEVRQFIEPTPGKRDHGAGPRRQNMGLVAGRGGMPISEFISPFGGCNGLRPFGLTFAQPNLHDGRTSAAGVARFRPAMRAAPIELRTGRPRRKDLCSLPRCFMDLEERAS